MSSGLEFAASVASTSLRIQISHATTYAYDQPPKGVTQVLRLSPRDHVRAACDLVARRFVGGLPAASARRRIRQHYSFVHGEGPFQDLTVTVEVKSTRRTPMGLVSGCSRAFSAPALSSRYVAHASRCQRSANLHMPCVEKRPRQPALAHTLLTGLNREMTFDTDPTHAATTATESFSLRRGVCQDITHIFIAAARALGLPARYVGGHFRRSDGVTAQNAGHAWAERI